MKKLAVAAVVACFAMPLLAQSGSPAARLAAMNDPARLVALGERMERQGELPGAMLFYERALELDPAYPMALRAAAENAMKRGAIAEAMRHYSVWANAEPRSPFALIGLATGLIAQRKPDEALAILDRAADLNGPKGAIEAQRGIALDLQGNVRAAQTAYAAALNVDPTDAITTQRMALSLALANDNGAAVTLMQRFGTEPESAEVRRTLAMIHALGGRQEDAAEIAASLFPLTEARQMREFYARLPRLTARERALAVHFGVVPGSSVVVPTIGISSPPLRLAQNAPTQAPTPTRAAATAPIVTTPVAAPAPPRAPAAPPAKPAPAEIDVANIDLSELARAATSKSQPKPPTMTASALKAQPRFWVQVSSLSDASRLPAEWWRVRAAAGNVVSGQAAYVQRSAGMNRLLIGPFATEWSARQMIGKLKARRVAAVFKRTPAGADLAPLG